MKIAFVSRRYYPEIGGIETHVKEVAERLAKRHEVIVFTLVNEDKQQIDEIINGVRVKRYKAVKLSYSIEFPTSYMLNEIRKFEPDIVHSHNAHTTIPYFTSRVSDVAKFVITPHYQGDATTGFRKILSMVYKPLLSRAISKADRLVCVSPIERDMLTNAFDLDPSKIRIIPNGVGSDLASIIPNRHQLRILSVARFDLNHKRTDKLIKAFKILESKKIDAKLVLVGSGPDKEKITRLVDDLSLSRKVEIKSGLSREQVVQEYATASIFVTASEHEAFGIAVAEALAAKLNVIVPNSTALSLFVNAGYASGIEAPVTPEKIADAIMICLENNKQVLEYPPYTWDMVAKELHKMYEELLSENR